MIIVGEHSCIFEKLGSDYLDCVCKNIANLCVPVFFVISSFFFFRKIHNLQTDDQRKKQLWLFEKRVITLYLFWFIIQFPYIIYLRKYDMHSIISWIIMRDFFLGGTFIASWFLGAMITGIPLIYIMRKNTLCKIFGSIVIFAIYMYIYNANKLPDDYQMLDRWYRYHIESPFLSLPRGIFWLMIGYYCSSQNFLKNMRRIPYYIVISLLVFILLLSPLYPIEYVSIPMVIILFYYVYRLSMRESDIYKKLRIYSIIIYCAHGTVLAALSFLFRPNVFLLTIYAILACMLLAETIRFLSSIPKFKILRYAY